MYIMDTTFLIEGICD